MANGISDRRVKRRALFYTGFTGGFLFLFPIVLLTLHVVLGIIALVGTVWATYNLFFLFLRASAEDEANERRTYVRRRRDLAKQEMKLLDSDLAAMDDVDKLSPHLNTCRCRLCL